MSLEDLGNLGDFIGGVAVVITLIYLSIQIRRNVNSIQAANIQSASHGIAEVMELIVSDTELLKLYSAGARDFESLSNEDRLRFASLLGVILHRFENLVAQTNRGFLPAESWEGAKNRLRGTFALPGTQDWWNRGKHVFNRELQDWVEEELIAKLENDYSA